MVRGKEVSVKIDIMSSKEIDFGDGKAKKRRQRTDEYDYDDPFIEPFEGEAQAVMIECNLGDFFVYSGQLPYSARRVLSVYKSKKARERAGKDGEPEDVKKTPSVTKTRRYAKIPKNDIKSCEYLASLIKCELDATNDKVGCYVCCLMLNRFQRERKTAAELDVERERPSDIEVQEYVNLNERRMDEVFDKVTEGVHDHRLYTENFSLFKGFNNESFLSNLLDYFVLFMKISFLNNRDASFNRTRREACANVIRLFSDSCRNSSQIQYYLVKYVSHRVRNMFGPENVRKARNDVSDAKLSQSNTENEDSASDPERLESVT